MRCYYKSPNIFCISACLLVLLPRAGCFGQLLARRKRPIPPPFALFPVCPAVRLCLWPLSKKAVACVSVYDCPSLSPEATCCHKGSRVSPHCATHHNCGQTRQLCFCWVNFQHVCTENILNTVVSEWTNFNVESTHASEWTTCNVEGTDVSKWTRCSCNVDCGSVIMWTSCNAEYYFSHDNLGTQLKASARIDL